MVEIKERPIIFSGEMVRAILEGRKSMTRRVIKPQPTTDLKSGAVGYWSCAPDVKEFLCPYRKPGDILWVRETWRQGDGFYGIGQSVFYRADEEWNTGASWKPSIHMPRRASRITLEIINIEVERLQEISEEDAQAEGMINSKGFNALPSYYSEAHYTLKFKKLWDSINAKRGFGWDVNPWVWMIEFKKVEMK